MSKNPKLMTDEYHAYNALSSQLKHHVINHQEQYVDGDKHTISANFSNNNRLGPRPGRFGLMKINLLIR